MLHSFTLQQPITTQCTHAHPPTHPHTHTTNKLPPSELDATRQPMPCSPPLVPYCVVIQPDVVFCPTSCPSAVGAVQVDALAAAIMARARAAMADMDAELHSLGEWRDSRAGAPGRVPAAPAAPLPAPTPIRCWVCWSVACLFVLLLHTTP